MEHKGLAKYTMLVLLAALGYLSYLVIEPFLSYLFFSVVLVMIFWPVHQWLAKKTNKPNLSSFILVVAVILLLVLPSIWIGVTVVRDAPSVYAGMIDNIDPESASNFLQKITGQEVDLTNWLTRTVTEFRNYALKNAGQVLTSATLVTLGLFTMLFTMYYMFTQGPKIMKYLRKVVPVSKKHQDALIKEVSEVINATVKGQFVLGIIQGILGWLIFVILSIPNALFLGFVMILASIVPFIGAFIVWVPVAIWLFVTGHIVKAIILTIFGFVVISQIDNLLRPHLVSRSADIHPVLVLVGVLGGLQVFGIIGFISGPLILGLFVTLLQFYRGKETS